MPDDEDMPTMTCPRCRAELPDFDGFGVLAHTKPAYADGCGFCVHAGKSLTDGRWACDYCGDAEDE